MRKVTSKLLTLLLSFAMVVTSIGWLGASEVKAEEMPETLTVKAMNGETPVSGVQFVLKYQGSNDMFGDESFEGVTGADGVATIDIYDDSKFTPLDEDDDFYKVEVASGGEYTCTPVDVVLGMDSDLYIASVGNSPYDGSAYPIQLTPVGGGDDPVPADAQLVDARIPEVYAGWAVDGNEVGGHLEGAVNFAAQWINAGYPDDTSGYKTKDDALKMALEDSGLDKTKPILVYDTNDSDAAVVAEFLRDSGCSDVATANKSEELKTATLVTYPNYKLNVPAEVAKNISDNRNSPNNLSEQAADIVGGRNIRIFHAEYCAAGKYTDDGYMEDNDIDWTKASGYYGKGHVPGAEPISTDDFEPERYGDRDIIDNANEGITWKADYLLRNDDELLVLAKKYGLHKDDFVLVAGYEPMATTKIALIMKYLGIDNVYVMSGAYTEWNQMGYDLEKETINLSAEETDISAIGNPDVIDTQDEAAAMLDNPAEYQLIDTRRVEEFEGKTSGYSYHDVAGRIPGADVNSPSGVGHSSSMYFYRNPDSTMRSPEVIEAMWKSQGVDTSKHMSFFCGSGWRAAEETWDAWVMGYENASMYNDGWQGWSNAERPFIDKDGNLVKVQGSSIVPVTDYVKMSDSDWKALGITVDELKAGDVMIDVRNTTMFGDGHFVGSINSPVSNPYTPDQKAALVKVFNDNSKADRIVIVCVSGNMLAKNAMSALAAAGKDMSKVTYLIGGARDNIAAENTRARTLGAEKERTMTTTIDMTKYEKGKVVKVWVPVPQTEDYQVISNEKFEAKTAKVAKFTTEKANGNKMLYLEWDANAEPAARIATLTFDAKRAQAGHDFLIGYTGENDAYPEDVQAYIDKESEYVKVKAPVVQEYAAEAAGGKDNTLEKARSIYEWVINNLARIDNGENIDGYTFDVEGCGYGNTVKILNDYKEHGIAGGHCTDLNSTFVALCRANGIPAREMFGIRMNDDATGGQHCWAEFYLPGTGWVYADPADVLKAVKPKVPEDKSISIDAWNEAKQSDTCKEKTEFFWGGVDENRIVLSRGRDITFEPAQAWGVCNTFGYPAAEVDGERLGDFTDAKNFVYSIACSEVKKPTPTPVPTPAATPAAATVTDGQTAAVASGTVKVLSAKDKTAEFTKAKNKKSVTVPATVTVNGVTLDVTQVGAKAFIGKKIRTVTIGKNVKKIKKNAFKGSKATKMIVKSKKLKKASVKGSLKGSKIKTVQVKVGKKKENKKYVKKYKKIFTKKNAGRKAKVK